MCWIPVCGGQGRFGRSQGAGQEHPSAVGSWSGSVGGLGAGEGPLSSEQPHVWQGTGPGAAALEPNLSQALLHPSSASFLPPSTSPPPPPSLSLHLYPPSISIPSSSPSSFHLYPSTPLLPPSPSPHLPPIPPKTTLEDTKNGARGVSNQLSQPSSTRMNVQPQTSTPKTQGKSQCGDGKSRCQQGSTWAASSPVVMILCCLMDHPDLGHLQNGRGGANSWRIPMDPRWKGWVGGPTLQELPQPHCHWPSSSQKLPLTQLPFIRASRQM